MIPTKHFGASMNNNSVHGAGEIRVAVIGAGMSGILTGIRLLEAGISNFVIYEKAASCGGTWRENSYPGLSCDVPSHHYVYTFEPNPEWSHMFSPGPEIRAYFERTAEKYGVASYIRYNTEVVAAEFNDDRWHLRFADGGGDEATVVIAATGVLHHPVYPDIDGLDTFAGPCFHSARWDHGVSLAGKRVGIIGTGSTAIQIVTGIVDEVASLDLFQRTAQWVLPYPNEPYSEEQKAEFRANPAKMSELFWHMSDQFTNSFARAVIGDETQMARIEQRCRMNLEHNIHDPELRARLTPDYKVACKRLIMSDSFYAAIQKPNAHLVTDGIARIEAQGVRTRDGVLHELDVLVLATGFDGHRFMRDIDIRGQGGVKLDDAWSQSLEAHRCLAVPGFPNFFMLIGPNSPIGNFSLILIAEMQVDYILKLIERIRAGACRALAPSAEATRRFNAEIRDAMKHTVWVSGCRSWYLDKNGTPITWPWSFERFKDDMREPRWAEYELMA
jgi:cation diffusion facilitator CzcD-associated flavoprotein CzcO